MSIIIKGRDGRIGKIETGPRRFFHIYFFLVFYSQTLPLYLFDEILQKFRAVEFPAAVAGCGFCRLRIATLKRPKAERKEMKKNNTNSEKQASWTKEKSAILCSFPRCLNGRFNVFASISSPSGELFPRQQSIYRPRCNVYAVYVRICGRV